jgi:cbb3-type cytochrome oxidase maturation protein
MDILYLLIPLSVMLAFLIGWFFWRAVDTGQFDDLDTPAVRILADDDAPDATRSSRGLTQINPPAARFFIIESIVNEPKP